MSNMLVEAFPPAPGGMNVALPAQDLDATEARYLQDILLDKPGLARRRGPVSQASGVVTLGYKASGFAHTLNPAGANRFAVLNGNGSNGYVSLLPADMSTKVDVAWPHAMPTDPASGTATAYRIVDNKAALNGGTFIGVSSQWDSNNPYQGLALWRGGISANYNTGTITVTRGSATVTGSGTSWLANITPGMFLFAKSDDYTTAEHLIGVVKLVNSDTSITLEQVSPFAITARSHTLQSIRGFWPKVAVGRITTDTASTTVSGGATKFRSQGLATGSWFIYRRSDLGYVGKVSAVASETSLTLTGNAALAMVDESYVALQADGDWSINTTANTQKVGFLNSTYAERQWYANNGATIEKTNRVWFSDATDPEAVDTSADGSWIPVSSTGEVQEPIKGLAAAYNALLVFKETETFAITGSSPSTFSVRKIEDDGVLSTGSIQSYGGGVIWAGKKGIHFYDGIQVTNLAQLKFGDVWKNSVLNTNPDQHRMYGMIVRDHYILHIESLDPSINVKKGNTGYTPGRWTVTINLVTRAFSLLTNVGIRGSVELSASGGGSVYYLVNDTSKGVICNSDDLFDSEGVDTVLCDLGDRGVRYTYGQTSATGYTTLAAAADTKYASSVTLPVRAAINDVRAYIAGQGSGTTNMKAVIYSDSSGSPNAVVATSTATSIDGTVTAPGWKVFSFSSRVELAAGTYWIALHNETGTVANLYRGATANAIAYNADVYSGGAADPFGATSLTTGPLAAYGTFYTVGPDFYFETKKFEAGDPLRLKRFKQVAIHYLAQGADLTLDSVAGLNNVGETQTVTFPATIPSWTDIASVVNSWDDLAVEYGVWDSLVAGVFEPRKVRVQTRSTHYAFRLWQASAEASRARVGPLHVAYKYLRERRVR